MTLTLQSVSKISKLEITNKPCDKITSSHLLHYESASPVQDQDQDNHNNNKNDNDNCLSLSTRLQESNTLHESRNTNGHYHHQHQNMLHRQFPSFSLHLSPFHQPIFNPNFIKSSKENYINPIFDTNLHQVILPIECGRNAALMFLSKLCQGSKGSCILFESCYWLTPNEFQCISGRETAKDWKRSIRHNGKSIKLLINKGILTVHSPLCECGTATPSSIKIGKLDMHQYSEGENCISSLHKNEGMKIIGGSVDANFTSKDSYGARWNKEVADYQEREDGSGSHRIVDSLGESETDDSASSPEWTFSSGFGGDRRLSHLPRIPRLVHSSDNHNLVNVEDRDELILSVSVSGGGVGDLGPQSRSSSDASSSSISTLTGSPHHDITYSSCSSLIL